MTCSAGYCKQTVVATAEPPQEEDPIATVPESDPASEQIYDNHTENNVISEYDTQEDKQAVLSENKQEGNSVRSAERGKQGKPEDKSQSRRSSSETILKERVKEAQRLAKSRTTTVTLRIPEELNAWLDEYVHLSFPERIKKQELVTEALQMVYARRGKAKEPELETPFLPSQKSEE